MSVLVDLLLGIATSIGGFVEAGSISTAAQAGAEFRFELLWAIAVAGAMIAMLTEMSGRMAIVSGQTVSGAIRERFGIHFQAIPLCAELVLDTLLLAAEIGGVAIALRLLTAIPYMAWLVPVAVLVAVILWTAGFKLIEDGLGLLGLITLSFVVAALKLHPNAKALGTGLIPSLPQHDALRYWALAVNIVGATVSPYLLNFYASGAIEEEIREKDLWVNRLTAFVGMGFGSLVAMGVLATAAMALAPRGIHVDSYDQAALMFLPAFGTSGTAIFAISLGIGCLGAAVEITLNSGYLLAQVFGWHWGANKPRRQAARFAVAMSIILVVATAVSLSNIDPLKLTTMSMALTVLVMPPLILPFLVLMNDRRYVKSHTSGALGNAFLALVTIVAALLALVVIPLQLLGG